MAIVPTSQITICRNVPLSPSYVHTVDFPSRTLQGAYFATMAKYVERDYTYIRSTGRIRVQHPIGDLIDCNYLFYNNVNFENKTIYCFIVDLKYINNETTEIITLEDVFQTWWPDCRMTQCLVEREHVDSDTIGANLVDEGLELGDYVTEANWWLPEKITVANLGYVFISSYQAALSNESPITYTISKWDSYEPADNVKLFNGLCMNFAPDLPHAAAMYNAFINDANGAQSVISITAVPRFVWQYGLASSRNDWVDYDRIDKPYDGFMRGQYVPRNKKLYTYPYKFARVRNDEGQEGIYRYEWFSNAQVEFAYHAILQPNFAIHMVPLQYRGRELENDSLVLSNWPQCGYVTDSYALWYAQNQVRYPAQIVSSAISSIGRLVGAAAVGALLTPAAPVTGAAAGAASAIVPNVVETGLSVVANRIAPQAEQPKNDPTAAGQWAALIGGLTDIQSKAVNNMAETRAHELGSLNAHYTGSDATMLMIERKKFTLEYMCITADMARRIDRYFDMFGYKVNLVKLPNVDGRHCWNYVKTTNCDVVGSVPQYATEAINTLFNNGITIWHNPSYIGNYDLDNYVDNG